MDLRRGWRSVAGVLVLVFAASVLVSGTARAEDTRRIAVVNVTNIFKAYLKVKDIQDKMERQFLAERNALDKEETDLKVWGDKLKLDGLPEDNPDKFRSMQQFDLARFEFERRAKKLVADVEEQKKKEMKAVLNDIKAAIRAIGDKENFSLVLRAPEVDEEFDPNAKDDKDKKAREAAQSAGELVQRFRENPVLYFAQGVDLTDKIIEKLNSEYKATAPVAPSPK
jgi:Skp family chaperone for outer membrane proteins